MLKPDIFLTSFIFVFAIAVTSCGAADKARSGGPYYFESFANYKIPFSPIGEMTYEEATKRESYYVAYYDNSGRITSFSKYLNGNLEFIDKYTYNDKGMIEVREMNKSSGEIIVQYFDKSGKIIQK